MATNLIELPYNFGNGTTTNGVTLTTQSDGTINLAGTATGVTSFAVRRYSPNDNIPNLVVPTGDYILFGGLSPAVRYRIGTPATGNHVFSQVTIDTGNGAYFSFNASTMEEIIILLTINSNTNVDNLSTKPILIANDFSVSLPNSDWSASPTNGKEGDTITLTYNGNDIVNSVTAYAIEGLDSVAVTSLGDNRWTLVLPRSDVGVNASVTERYPITSSQNSGGTISNLPSYAPEGQTVTFVVTPNTGYSIYNVSSNQVEINRNVFGTYSFIMPASAVSIVVQFQTAPVGNIVVEPQPGGTITANPTTAQEGETVTLTVSTLEGYTFQGVVVTRGNHLVSTTQADDNHYTFVVENL